MVFSCNGSVTKWVFGAENYEIPNKSQLQIWRKLSSNNYIKIAFSSVNGSTMIGTNFYEFTPQIPLEFQEGDIFGVYAGHPHGNNAGLVLFEQKESGPINLRINPSLTSPPSTITQTLITANNDFPLVTLEISKPFLKFLF